MASVKIFAATLVMTAIITLIALVLPVGISAIAHVVPVGAAWGQSLVQLVALTGAGIVCMFALAKWWHMPEWKWTLGQIDADIQAVDNGP